MISQLENMKKDMKPEDLDNIKVFERAITLLGQDLFADVGQTSGGVLSTAAFDLVARGEFKTASAAQTVLEGFVGQGN